MSQEARNEGQEAFLQTESAVGEAGPTSDALLQQLIVSSGACTSLALSGAASREQLALVRTLLLHAGRSDNTQRLTTLDPPLISDEELNRAVSDAYLAAAEKGHASCLRLLLDASPDMMSAVTACDAAGCTALMLAARNGHIDCITTLLEQHASVQLTAGCSAPTADIDADTDTHADTDSTSPTERTTALPRTAATTALMFAARKGSEQCVRLLLQHGSPAAAADASGWTALMWAAWGGHAGCIAALLEGADCVVNQLVAAASTSTMGERSIHHDDRYYEVGTNALMLAAAKGRVGCVRVLLAHSPAAQVTAADRFGQNALVWAADRGYVKCMRLLLAHSPELQLAAGHRDRRGFTALMISADQARADCVALLLKTAAEAQVLVVIPDDRSLQGDCMPGTNALMLAVMYVLRTPPKLQQAGVECVRLLLAHNPAAQVAAADSDGWTALMWAAAGGRLKSVALLLSHNPSAQVAAASRRKKSDDNGPLSNLDIGNIPAGYSALMLAVKRGHLGCVRLLLQHNPEAQVAARTRAGKNALMRAAGFGKVKCLTPLLAHSPSTQVLAVDGSGRSALSLAASKGRVACVRLLLEHVSPGSHLDESLTKAAGSIAEAQQAVGAAAEDPKGARRRRCLELMIARGAKLPVNAQAAAVVTPIVHDLARRALVPDRALEAVVGLASASAGCRGQKRQRTEGGEAK